MYIFENENWTIQGVREIKPTPYSAVHSFTVDAPLFGVNISSNH